MQTQETLSETSTTGLPIHVPSTLPLSNGVLLALPLKHLALSGGL
jgi:hypothetical protein